MPRLSPSALAEFEIPLPPLAEQRRIAEVLDRAEALRAKRRAALAQLDSLTHSLFLDLRAENFSTTLNVFEAEVGSPLANRLWLNRGTLNRRDIIERDGIPIAIRHSKFALHRSIPSSSFMPC